jgi:hypothetical protein
MEPLTGNNYTPESLCKMTAPFLAPTILNLSIKILNDLMPIYFNGSYGILKL